MTGLSFLSLLRNDRDNCRGLRQTSLHFDPVSYLTALGAADSPCLVHLSFTKPVLKDLDFSVWKGSPLFFSLGDNWHPTCYGDSLNI